MVFETLSGLEVKTEPKEKSRRNRSSFHLLEESVKALSKGTSLVSVEWLPLSANLGLCSRTVNETASESFWLKVQVNLSRGRESPALIQELKRLSAEESTEEIGCDLDFYSCCEKTSIILPKRFCLSCMLALNSVLFVCAGRVPLSTFQWLISNNLLKSKTS